MKDNSFQALLQRFFLERLMNQRNASPCTIRSYRDTFRIFLGFMRDEKKCAASKVRFEMLNAENILEFLDHLENARGNALSTLNNRLAAIHAFMDYVSYQDPEYLSLIQRVMAIPFKRTETRSVNYLTLAEVEAIIDACDLASWSGRRDRIMVSLLYNTGARISELLGIRVRDLAFNPGTIRVMGKGRKERIMPMWKATERCLANFVAEIGNSDEAHLFTNQHGETLTRSGAKYRLDKLVETASCSYPSLRKKHVTPHVFRHTTAMHLLEAGVDLSTIAIWLGHESIETTHKYMVADLQLKERALAQISEPKGASFRYKPSNDILSFLDKL